MEELTMPMIDVYAPADVFPPEADEDLGRELTHAVLRAEGVVEPGPFHLDNTAAFIHRLPAPAISTAGTPSSRTVRVQIVTPPGALSRDGQRQIVAEATEIVASFAGEAELKNRTWVILTEAAEWGWVMSGTAFGAEEFTVL